MNFITDYSPLSEYYNSMFPSQDSIQVIPPKRSRYLNVYTVSKKSNKFTRNNAKLEFLIALTICSHAQSFRFSKDPMFQEMIMADRNCSEMFELPSRYIFMPPLLDSRHDTHTNIVLWIVFLTMYKTLVLTSKDMYTTSRWLTSKQLLVYPTLQFKFWSTLILGTTCYQATRFCFHF